MRRSVLAAALAVATMTTLAPAASAGPIERACMAAGRGATAALCGCIQKVADSLLDGAEQRLASTFFADPHKAQEVRMSDRADHARFWDTYKVFGAQAEAFCR